MGGQNLKVVNNNCTFGSNTGEHGRMEKERKKKARIQATGYQTRSGIGKCLTKTPNMKADKRQNLYKMLCESRLLFGVEIRRVRRGGKQWTAYREELIHRNIP